MICSNVSDNSVMVHDGENGFLFDPLDVNDMYRAFLTFLRTTSDERDKMGKKSREIAESLFDRERFVNQYVELIEK